jgi:hypothetical protein
VANVQEPRIPLGGCFYGTVALSDADAWEDAAIMEALPAPDYVTAIALRVSGHVNAGDA